jgi:hypothetical protein
MITSVVIGEISGVKGEKDTADPDVISSRLRLFFTIKVRLKKTIKVRLRFFNQDPV